VIISLPMVLYYVLIGDYANIITQQSLSSSAIITNEISTLASTTSTFIDSSIGNIDWLSSVTPSMVVQLLLVAQIMIKSVLIHHMVISLYVVTIVQVHSQVVLVHYSYRL
jgi:hypothetical protein